MTCTYHRDRTLGCVVCEGLLDGLVGIYPDEAGVPATPGITCSEADRSPEVYAAILAEADVEHRHRYAPGIYPFSDGKGGVVLLYATRCNCRVQDATAAMGCPLPRVSANNMATWLEQHGAENGWLLLSGAAEAQSRANAGLPTVGAWRNPEPEHSGHVVMVAPKLPGDVGDGPFISQAGAHNLAHAPASHGWGPLLNQVRYWGHS